MADTRLGPEEWVRAGLKALAKSGASALKADKLAAGLGVSRGSFYWHFADVPAFHAAVLRRWREVALENIIAEIETTSDPLEALLHRAFAGGSGVESAVRAWERPTPRRGRRSNRSTRSGFAICRSCWSTPASPPTSPQCAPA